MKKYFLLTIFSMAICHTSLAQSFSAAVPPVAPNTLPDSSPKVSHGSLSIKTSGASMDMHAGSGKTIAEFNGFNIGGNAEVTVNMGADDAMLASDISGNASHILGKLNIQQGLFALQGQELVLHNGAILNVGEKANFAGISGHVSDSSFMQGKMEITGTGSIHNAATVYLKEGGFFGLCGESVSQTGHIVGDVKNVSLVGGEKATLSFVGNDLIGFVLPEDKTAKSGSVTIEKEAKIETNGGNIHISAQTAEGLVQSTVRVDGIVSASSLRKVGGKIILDGGNKLEISGTVKTTGDQAGDIITKGKSILINEEAILDVSGKSRAGSIQIGGRRIKNGPNAFLWDLADITADDVEIKEGAKIKSTRSGDGTAGDIFVIARNNLKIKGATFDVRSWGKGNGGFLEFSVLNRKANFNDLDMGRVFFENYDKNPTSKAGQLLFDPETLTVGTDITASAIQTALIQGDVLLMATQDVIVNEAIEWSSKYALLLAATDVDPELEIGEGSGRGGRIAINQNITMNGDGAKLLLWQGAGERVMTPAVINNDAIIKGTGADNYVTYSIPKPIDAGDIVAIGNDDVEGVEINHVTRVPGEGDTADTDLIIAIQNGGASNGFGLHVPRNITVPILGSETSVVSSLSEPGYKLTAFNLETDNFTSGDDTTGFYSGSGNMIGVNTITFGDSTKSIPFFNTITAKTHLSFADFQFPGNIVEGAAIAITVDGYKSFHMDRINLDTNKINPSASGGVGGFFSSISSNATISLRNITGTIGNIGHDVGAYTNTKLGIFVGQNFGTFTLDNVEITASDVYGESEVGLISGRNGTGGTINVTNTIINGTPTIGQSGATNTGLLVGNQQGTFTSSNLLIEGGTVLGDSSSTGGLFGAISGTTTLSDFRVRSLTATNLNLLKGTGGSIEFSNLIQMMRVNAGSFDLSNIDWNEGNNNEAYGVISGKITTFPDEVIDTTVPSNVTLRFFNDGGDTFYRKGTDVPDFSQEYSYSKDDVTVLNLRPQESSALPPQIIQFGTVDDDVDDVYETYRYTAENDQGYYTLDTDTTSLIVDPVTTPTTTTSTNTDAPNLSSDLEIVDDIGDESEDYADIDDNELEDDSDVDNSESDDDLNVDDDTQDDEENDDEDQKDENKSRRQGGDILSLIKDSDGDNQIDVGRALRQGT